MSSPNGRAEAAIPGTLEAFRVPVEGLRRYGRNPRQGDVGAIVESLERHGQYRPIVVNARTMEVLAGNHTLEAVRQLGWGEVAASFVDVDEDQAARIVLVDNRSNDLASYDDQALADLLRSLPDLEGTGYDGNALDELIGDMAAQTPGMDTDPADLPEDPRTTVGDLYALGDHRLLCGDATESGHVARLMGGGVAGAMWTDPPYGVSYVGKTQRALTIANDDAALPALLQNAFALADEALAPGAPIYVAHPAGARHVHFGAAFLGQGWRLHQTLVWVKDTMVLGHSDYHYRHEPILYGYKLGVGRQGRGGEGWYGDHTQTSVFEIPRPSRSEQHPTMKPVELIEVALGNSTRPGCVVLDLFGGSGSTLLAGENLGRRVRMMEIDPAYCDVIVDRWERHTGRTAERIEDGATAEVFA